jgi:hypothetical protein
VRRFGQALEHPTERLLRLLVEDRPQVLAEEDAEIGVLPERADHDPAEREIRLERDERRACELVEDLREIVELLDDERELRLGVPAAARGHLAAARPRDLTVEVHEERREVFLAFPEELRREHRHVSHASARGAHLLHVVLERRVRTLEGRERQAVDLEEPLEALQPHFHLEQVVVLDPVREEGRSLENREARHGPF